MYKLSILLLALVLPAAMLGCGSSDDQSDPNAHTHAGPEGHEHGEETHTHDMPADTAGTYLDTTGAFFGTADSAAAGDADAPEDGHEHGPDTHSH